MRVRAIIAAAALWFVAGADLGSGLGSGAAAQGACGAVMSAACAERLGAGAIGLDDTTCQRQWAAYRACIKEMAESAAPAAAPAAGAGCSEARAQSLWADAKELNSCLGYEGFRAACPATPEARFAAAKMRQLRCGQGDGGDSAATAGAEREAARPSAAPSPPGWTPSEADFRAAQRELKRLGLYQGAIDGAWGGGSTRALRGFERETGVSPADGLVKETTLAALQAAPTPERPSETFTARLLARPRAGLKECDACPALAAIPSGSFTMGSPSGEADRQDDEGPTRRVTVGAFALGRDAVTVAEFRRFARATRREMKRCYTLKSGSDFGWVDGASWERPGFSQGDDHPAICVSWEDAKAYVAWLNDQVEGAPYRLPSEAEQEYVLRADHGSAAYPWGGGKNAGCGAANGADQSAKRRFSDWTWASSCNDGHVFTAPAAAFLANRWGVRQLSGNVWEWAADCWNNSYSGAPSDGSAWKSGDCSRAVLRGGSWDGYPWWLRSAHRGRSPRDGRYNYFGFRVARTHVE